MEPTTLDEQEQKQWNDSTVTMSVAGGKEVTLTGEQFDKAIDRLCRDPGINIWTRPHLDSDSYPVPSEESFIDDAGSARDFIPAADIGYCAEELMLRHKERFGRLQNFRISYRWRAKGGQKSGKYVLGRCQKTAGLVRHFSEADFVIMISADWCRAAQFTFAQMEALVFHELCHAGITDKWTPKIIPHDFEGFYGELEVYGPWTKELKSVESAFKQRTLFEQEGGDRAD